MINFDDLKKEFENFDEKCLINPKEDEEEELEGDSFIEIIRKDMLTPAICGFYFSRLDIKAASNLFGESVQVRERRRMLRDLLKSILSKDDMEKLFDIFKAQIDHKLSIYKELAENFPASKEIFEENIKKAEKFKRKLDKILNEFD